MTILWLPDVLEKAGLGVIKHDGWEKRAASGSWNPVFGVVHGTGAPVTQPDSTQIRIVRDGREGLPGPIANCAVDRSGKWHVLSAGRCTGIMIGDQGPYQGFSDSTALQVEACNNNTNEAYPAVQYESYVRGYAAICKRMGWAPSRVVGHKEHQSEKIDPNFSMAKFRQDVSELLGLSAPNPVPAKARSWQEEIITGMDVLNLSKVTKDAKTWVNGEDTRTLQGALCARKIVVVIDGKGGPETKAALGVAQRKFRTGVPSSPGTADYVAGQATWTKLLLA